MKEKKDDQELSNVEKFIALCVVAIITVVALLGISMLNNESDLPSFNSCETKFDSTPCPEPSTEPEGIENYPDATEGDHPDNCGGYSCDRLEREALQEQEYIDQQMQ